ncbi:MAG: TonB-dependent hemoglobin/transferrin/lactoferrin family receptor [Helicobacteraceae bacterium]
MRKLYLYIFTAVAALANLDLADQNTTNEELEKVVVQDADDIKDKKIGETIKDAKTLTKQQVQDTRDLVRYETGISVVEGGRFGASGYSVRGVDENRVSIITDGLAQAETLSSQGFKELFEGYGNFNNTRNGVEVENLKRAIIKKGADSIKTGSGSLGGAVIFETKDARDYLLEKNYFVGYKAGYSTANRGAFHSLTAAGAWEFIDALIVKTYRKSHELENYDYKKAQEIQGKEREKTDPYTITNDSTLLKLGFNIGEFHRVSFAYDASENSTRGSDFSYNLKFSKNIDREEKELRHTDDKSNRKNIAFTYENFSSNAFWDTLKISYANQRIKTRAKTDDYCDGSNCDAMKNPAGLQLKDGKVKDKYGRSNYHLVDKDTMVDSHGNTYKKDGERKDFGFQAAKEIWFDCSIFDCNAKHSYWHLNGALPPDKKEAPLTKRQIVAGKTFATFDDAITQDLNNGIILPPDKGYTENMWGKRDINTNTRQLNVDLTKDVDLWQTSHALSYGGIYSKTEKEMVNVGGYYALKSAWWARKFLGLDIHGKPITCETATGADQWDALLCPHVDKKFSFLIPVQTLQRALYISDEIKLNSLVSLDLAYRIDSVRYEAKYKHGVTPPIPGDMVRDLFIKMPKNPTEKQKEQNLIDNIKYISKPKTYKENSYALTINLDPLDFLRIGAKYSKGFRSPTADEIYFTFRHPDFTILPNSDLKAEIGKTKEAAATFYGSWGFATASAFRTDYENFIDLDYKGTRQLIPGKGLEFSLYQNINRKSAYVKGFELNSMLNLKPFDSRLDGFYVGVKYTNQKGRMQGNKSKKEGEIAMNAIQPATSVLDLGYSGKSFGADLYITSVAAKRAQDTYNMYWQEEQQKDKIVNGSKIKDTGKAYRSDAYTLFDLIAYVKPQKNLTLRGGIYNITNKKYLTWEQARSVKSFGTSNLINQENGKGLNRFYSAGRNYKVNIELGF